MIVTELTTIAILFCNILCLRECLKENSLIMSFISLFMSYILMAFSNNTYYIVPIIVQNESTIQEIAQQTVKIGLEPLGFLAYAFGIFSIICIIINFIRIMKGDNATGMDDGIVKKRR